MGAGPWSYIRRVVRPRPLIAVAALVLTVSGCAIDDYSGASTRRDLAGAGLSSEQAECVVTGLRRAVTDQRLGARDEPTDKESAAAARVLSRCGITPGP
jgi:hypothetical protein